MEGLEQERRGVFGGVKPPFDLNAVILAFVALLLFLLGVKVIEWGVDEPHVLARVVHSINLPYVEGLNKEVVTEARWDRIEAEIQAENERRLEKGARVITLHSPQPIVYVWIGLLALILWAYFGGAIGRIMAMKIARDEGLEIVEALKFGGQKFLSNIISIIVIAIAICVLYILCNTVIAGWIASIPYVGEILLILMYPFIFLSCLIVMLLFVPLVLGNTLMSSAIATESSDSFDGMSRAFSYVYSRPFQVILYLALMIVYMFVFVYFALLFFDISVGSLRTGRVGLDVTKARILEGFVDERNTWSAVEVDKKLYENAPGAVLKKDEEVDAFFADPDNLKETRSADLLRWPMKISGTVVWFLIWVGKGFMIAYLIAFWFAANQAMYFILRRDVDGEDPSEIYIEEEKEEEPFEITTPDEAKVEGGPPAAVTSAETKAEEEEPPPAAPKRSPSSRKKRPSKPSSRRSSRSSSRRGKKSGRSKGSE